MKEGANVFEVGVAFLDSLRLCCGKVGKAGNAADVPNVGPKDPFDCVLVCEGDDDITGSEDGEEKIADLGRLAATGAGDVVGFLAKGLLRRCAAPLALKAMLSCMHPQCWMFLRCVESQVQLDVEFMRM